jgi:hypothetical protein
MEMDVGADLPESVGRIGAGADRQRGGTAVAGALSEGAAAH